MPPIIGPHEAAWVWISGWMRNLNLTPENTPCTADADLKSRFVDHLGNPDYVMLDALFAAGKACTHVTISCTVWSVSSEKRTRDCRIG